MIIQHNMEAMFASSNDPTLDAVQVDENGTSHGTSLPEKCEEANCMRVDLTKVNTAVPLVPVKIAWSMRKQM